MDGGRENGERCNVLDSFSLLDFRFRPMANEDGFPSPFDDDVLAFRNGRKIDLDFSLGEHVGGGGHVD